MIRDVIWLPTHRPRMAEIAERVADLYGLTAQQIRTATLSRKLAPARQHAMWEMHDRGYSNLQIAHFFGLTDHTSVVYGRRRHDERIATEAQGKAA